MKDSWGAMTDPTRREILAMLQKQDITAREIFFEMMTVNYSTGK